MITLLLVSHIMLGLLAILSALQVGVKSKLDVNSITTKNIKNRWLSLVGVYSICAVLVCAEFSY